MKSVVALFAMLSVVLVAHAGSFAGGTGTLSNPYQIATAQQLINMGSQSQLYHHHFVLIADIDLDPALPGNRIFSRAVIAPNLNNDVIYTGNRFGGTFDGQDHIIDHLTIEGVSYLGLFGMVAESGTIRNLRLTNVSITGVTGHFTDTSLGGLVGKNEGSLIRCASVGSVSGNFDIGLLTGRSSGVIRKCYSFGNVNGTQSTGGLVGANTGVIANCMSAGTVNGEKLTGGVAGFHSGELTCCSSCCVVKGDETVGGLVGQNGTSIHYNCTIDNSYCVGSSQGRRIVGGFVGQNAGAISNCYSRNAVIMTSSWTPGLFVGSSYSHAQINQCFLGTLPRGNYGMSVLLNAPPIVSTNRITSFLKAGWDFVEEEENGLDDIWTMGPTGYPILFSHINNYSGGAGTMNDPYQIGSMSDLLALGQTPLDYDKCFVLRNHIDLDPNLPGCRCFDSAVIAWNIETGSEFRGIPFTGTFDGNDFCIQNLTIDSPLDFLGLFGVTGENALLTHLKLERCTINGESNTIGSLIGWSDSSTIIQCESIENTLHGLEQVGGLIGMCQDSTIRECCSQGTVTGEYRLGGLIGNANQSHLQDCYSWGLTGGYGDVGGLVGFIDNGSMENCYCANTIETTQNKINGLIGNGGMVENLLNSFWDIQAAGLTVAPEETGLFSEQLHNPETTQMAGWDLNNIWIHCEGEYPRLRWSYSDCNDFQ